MPGIVEKVLVMKHLLISFLAATAVTAAFAQTPAATVKIDPKNNKVGKPVVDKPKVKLMSRDELRFCLTEDRDILTEAKAIKTAEATIMAARDGLRTQRAADDKRDQELTAATPMLKLDIEAMTKYLAEFQADTKLDKAALKAKQDDYTARSAVMQTRIDEHNKALQDGRAARTTYNAGAEVFTKGLDEHNVRVEKHLDRQDARDIACKNKSYDSNDETAIKKELGITP